LSTSIEKANEVLDRFNQLTEEMDRLKPKVEAAELPVGEPSAQQVANFTATLRKFRDLQRVNQVLGNLFVDMDAAGTGTPEVLRVYEKMLTTIERAQTGIRELDKLLDEGAALSAQGA